MKFRPRQATEKVMKGLCLVMTVAIIGILFLIISQIFINGLPSLNWYFITTPENAAHGMGEGIANAIVGTILISLCATILAAPFGFGTAVYMKRYAPDNAITRAFRFLLEVLSGTPSIVLGIFAFLVFVIYLKKITGGFSLISGSIALAILIMPVIERAIEDAIDRVPPELEEGSYALGADKWQTISGITVPAAFSAILTGFTLGFGRAAEESAVVILSAGYTQYMPEFAIRSGSDAVGTVKIYPIQDQVATLPYTVYHAFQNQVVVKPSAGFAAAFVLIVVVFTINITAKALLRSSISSGKARDSFIVKVLKGRKVPAAPVPSAPDAGTLPESPEEDDWTIPSALLARPGEPVDGAGSSREKTGISRRVQNLTASLPFLKKEQSPAPDSGRSSPAATEQKKPAIGIPRDKAVTFLRAFIPFVIPAAILLLISFLAGIPPLHTALGPASASLAGIFASGLSIIVTVSGLVFAFFIARKGGGFRPGSLRAGGAGVAAGICILCIAGIVASSAAAGLFSTGENTTFSNATDRNAQLAAMLASGQLGSDTTTPQETPAAVHTPEPAPVLQGGDPSSLVPVKDALSLNEYYTYGSGPRTVRATVYDTKVLPYYFWWYIDYNRFVQSSPAPGDSFLVLYVRAEDTGEKSAMIPSADRFNLTYMGTSYPHLPYLNTSVFSSYQLDYYSTHYDKLPYQWIRELGQDRRDYAFLTQYIGFNWNSTTTLPNGAIIPNTANGSAPSSTSLDTTYSGYFIQPGASNAIDGYLIYEVPDVVTKDLQNAYLQVSFNQLSATRWKLG